MYCFFYILTGTFTPGSSNSYLDEVSFQPLNAFFGHLDKLGLYVS